MPNDTLAFLGALTDTTPATVPSNSTVMLQWQTFDDRESKLNRPWTQYGSYRDLEAKLTQANQEGSGIYITINETDGEGRKLANIVGIRAYWADLDGVDVDLESLPLKPSIVVQSKAGKHLYWLSYGDVTFSEHKRIQERIADYLGSDTNVKDASRVLRVPGFYHNKGAPFLVTLLSHNTNRYTFLQMKEAF